MAGNNSMTAARLEELAGNADRWVAEGGNKDLLDLARCARGWAKLERTRPSAVYINHITATWFDEENNYFNGPTALEAVEAAEVKP